MRKLRELKVWPEYFWLLQAGIKTFEVRALPPEEPEFEVGEVIILEEYEPAREVKTGNTHLVRVTYILKLADSDEYFTLPFPKRGHPVYCLGVRPL